jgi:FkbM family methyltransferase
MTNDRKRMLIEWKRVSAPVGVALLGAIALYYFILLPSSEELTPFADQPAVDSETLRLIEIWGPKKYSEDDEELRILEFFNRRRGGFFVDVGAYHYRDLSNTYRLEKEYGWGGVAIDAQEDFAAGYEEHRPKTHFFPFYVSDVDDDLRDFFIVKDRETQSTGIEENAQEKITQWKRKLTTVQIPQITLNTLLDSEGVEQIDFLNMDIELAEPAALRGFDIDRFRPELVCIETHAPVAEFLERYFAEHGYVDVVRWSQPDWKNSYYVRGDLVSGLESRRWASLLAASRR